MNIFELISNQWNLWLSEVDLDVKWQVTKMQFESFWITFSDKVEATTHAIAHDPTFWITGAFLAALVLFADTKQKDERNVEFG